MSKAAQIALRALQEVVDQCGVIIMASDHIPMGVRVVTINEWREYSYRMGISTSPEDRAKQQAFKRASDYLISGGRVGYWDGRVWLMLK